MSHMIEVNGLKKSYGSLDAVRGIDFYVEAGKLFAFLGPNGAGKSTTIDMLCTLQKPTAGTVTVDGHCLGREDDAIRNSIGVVFQDSVLDSLLTVRENLMIRAGFYKGMDKPARKAAVREAAITADVMEFIDRPYGKLSGGQRRRADIARALVHTPKVLFLDEPTTGLDPKTKESVWQTVFQLQKRTGMTIFLTTHYMEEAATADYIILLNHGQIAAKGTPYELKQQYSSDHLRMMPKDQEALRKVLKGFNLPYTEEKGVLVSNLSATVAAIPFLQQAQPYLESFEVLHGTMEDVFLKITGGENE